MNTMQRIERGLVTCLLPDQPALAPSSRQQVVDTAAGFVSNQVRNAPFHVRFGAWILGTCLYVWLTAVGAMSSGAPYRRAELAIARFQRIAPVFAAIVRLYRSMALLAYYEHPIVAAALGFEDAEKRQAEFRVRRARVIERTG